MMYVGKIEITYKKKIFAHRKERELYTWRCSRKPSELLRETSVKTSEKVPGFLRTIGIVIYFISKLHIDRMRIAMSC
jgi:hypothetical protein